MYQPFAPPQRLLMGPGPTMVHNRVLEASARPTIGHLDPAFRKHLLENHGLEIGAGLGTLAGKIWRIGLMGQASRAQYVKQCLDILQYSLTDHRAHTGT